MLAESLVQDVRYACRGARRAPLFAVSVAGTMGIGLGVLCSAFTIFNAYLFKTVHLPQPAALHGLTWNSAARERHEFTLAEFEALAAGNPVFAKLAAGNPVTAAMPNGQTMAGHLVSGEYFAVLGAPAALGRTLTSADVTPSPSAAVVVLSDLAWRRHFDADPSIVGREIVLAGVPLRVIGVTRPGATLPGDETVGFWAPLTLATTFGVLNPVNQDRSLFVVGRRGAAATEDQVHAWFDTWLRQRFAGTDLEPVRTLTPSLATRIPRNRVTLTLFTLLMAAFGMVLLIACANVANMLLARGLGRQRELGVRVSLGASRGRLVRQLLIESSVLAVPAAGIGLLCTFAAAWVFPRIMTTTMPAGDVVSQVLAPTDPDLRVVTVLMAAGLLAALVAGLSPALQLARTSLVDAMRGQIVPGARISRLRNAFVTVQIATCVLFFVAAIAFVVESRRMASDETGLDYERIVTVRAPAALRPAIAQELAAHADVAAVSAAWRPPLISPMSLLRVTPPDGVTRSAGFMVVSADYFDTLGVRVLRGRGFRPGDAGQHADLIVVSESTARLFWPGRDPIDQKLDIVPTSPSSPRQPAVMQATVVGVVEDVINGTLLDGVARTSVYFPTTAEDAEARWLLVRTRGDAAAAVNRIASALRGAHPETTLDVGTLGQHAAVQVWAFRALSTASGLPAAIGLLLAFAGVYGVVAFVMTQRTREFGIRMALGATAGSIVRSVVGNAVRTATLAAALGILSAAVALRGFAALMSVRPVVSPSIYAAAALIVVAAAAAASLIPAMRATRLDPSSALRTE